MADRRITDLDPIGALATGDLFVVTDANQSDIAKSATIDTVSSYVVAQVPSSARPFGSAVNQISTWAEGNNLDIIPASKLPASSVPDLSNYMTLDTTQTATGVKNFTNLLSNSQEVVTLGNDQTITGVKTFSNPLGIQVENIVGATETTITGNGRRFLDYNNTFADVLTIHPSLSTVVRGSAMSIQLGNSNVNVFTATEGMVAINNFGNDVDLIMYKQGSGPIALSYNSGTDTLLTEADNLEGFAGAETGTFTPVFTNGGTEGTKNGSYSKTGQTVVCHVEAVIAASTSASSFRMSGGLPFGVSTGGDSTAFGSYYTASGTNPTGTTTSGTCTVFNGDIYFLVSASNTRLGGDDLRGYLGFTITYQTDD